MLIIVIIIIIIMIIIIILCIKHLRGTPVSNRKAVETRKFQTSQEFTDFFQSTWMICECENGSFQKLMTGPLCIKNEMQYNKNGIKESNYSQTFLLR